MHATFTNGISCHGMHTAVCCALGYAFSNSHFVQHDKPKPWDDDSVDHWKVEPFRPEDNLAGLQEESSFACLFPKYREKYLREAWPSITRMLKEVGIACELNLVEGCMTVRTTRKTYDPFVIVKARDLIKLLSRSVPAAQVRLAGFYEEIILSGICYGRH